jgi:hypothetical protein
MCGARLPVETDRTVAQDEETTPMQLALRSHGSRAGRLIGVAAAAGAFGAAAMMSAATAPTARADDFAAVETDISGELADGQTAFGATVSDFGSGNVIGGLEAFIEGADDDTIGVPAIATVGAVDELTNEPFSLTSGFFDFNSISTDFPTSFSGALPDAEGFVTDAEICFGDVSSALSAGDYGLAATDSVLGAVYLDLAPQALLIGGAEALGFGF